MQRDGVQRKWSQQAPSTFNGLIHPPEVHISCGKLLVPVSGHKSLRQGSTKLHYHNTAAAIQLSERAQSGSSFGDVSHLLVVTYLLTSVFACKLLLASVFKTIGVADTPYLFHHV